LIKLECAFEKLFYSLVYFEFNCVTLIFLIVYYFQDLFISDGRKFEYVQIIVIRVYIYIYIYSNVHCKILKTKEKMKSIKMLELSISSVVIKCTSNKIFVKKRQK